MKKRITYFTPLLGAIVALVLLVGFAETNEVVMTTDKDFEETTKKGLVIVDFYADWCAPCKKFAPTFEKTAKEMSVKGIVCAKANTANNREAAKKYHVKSIPTLIVFKDGVPVERKEGLMDEAALKNLIEKNI